MNVLFAAASDPELATALSRPTERRSFSVEFSRRGVFLCLGRYDAYLCTEPYSAVSFDREDGGLDWQLWRLHLIVGRVPA